jgi:hypothetical protein
LVLLGVSAEVEQFDRNAVVGAEWRAPAPVSDGMPGRRLGVESNHADSPVAFGLQRTIQIRHK